MDINLFAEHIWKKTAERKFFQPILADHILDEDFSASPFQKHKHYFNIHLSEMFLQYSRKGTKKYAPLSIMVSKFLYAGQEQSLPFFIGSKMLGDFEEYFGREIVEFRNIPVVGPVPYAGGGLNLFAGLCQVEVDDLAERFLSIFGKIAGVFDIAALSGYLKVAGPILEGLNELIDTAKVKPLCAQMQHLSDSSGGHSPFEKGYLAYINTPETDQDAQRLWVKNEELLVGDDPRSAEHLKDADYLLLRLGQDAQRDEYETLPSEGLWKEAQRLIHDGALEKAKFKFLETIQETRTSPDLTGEDKNAQTMRYKVLYESEMDLYRDITRGGIAEPILHRGAAKTGSCHSRIKESARLAGKAGFPASIEKAINNVCENLKSVPGIKESREGEPGGKEAITQQIMAVKNTTDFSQVEPNDLIDAILVTELGS